VVVQVRGTGLGLFLAKHVVGADDYVTKPFEAAELLARIEVLLLRVGTHAGQGIYEFGSIMRRRSASRI
jgi:DNA-binding response OmpR family regulator